MLIFLIGFMGAGKTTLGRQFAEKEDFEFLDLDDCIIEQAGVSIPQIFEKEGEAGFRKRERAALHKLGKLNKKPHLIACGGGKLSKQLLAASGICRGGSIHSSLRSIGLWSIKHIGKLCGANPQDK